MRKLYFVLCVLLFAAIGVQFYLAGTAAFTKPQTDSTFDAHKMNGMMIIPALSVLATIAAIIARVPRKLIGMTILVAALIPVQILINTIGGRDDARSSTFGVAVMGLHVINGLVIMLVARAALQGARAMMKARSGEPGGPAEGRPAGAAEGEAAAGAQSAGGSLADPAGRSPASPPPGPPGPGPHDRAGAWRVGCPRPAPSTRRASSGPGDRLRFEQSQR